MNLNKIFKNRPSLWMTLLSAIAPAFFAPKPVVALELPIDLCVVSNTFTRPTPEKQIEFISSNPRYNFPSDEAILQVHEWANNFLIYRLYYGGSGYEDLVRVSGYWNRINHVFEDGVRGLSECNSEFAPRHRNIMQIWAFSHQVQKVEWTGDRYVITVKPTGQGIQIFQFRKQVSEPSPGDPKLEELPIIEIVDEAGSTLYLCQREPEPGYNTICR